MDKACELCYVAKKYMLPVVVQRCTEFLWSDLNAKNVCRAFEFAKLFEEPALAERCLQVHKQHLTFNVRSGTFIILSRKMVIAFVSFRLYAVKLWISCHHRALKMWNYLQF